MSGGGRREPGTRKLMSPHVTASWGGSRCLELLQKKQRDPELRDLHGNRAIDLVLGDCHCVQGPWDLQHSWDWTPAEDPGGPRCSLSFLTDDGNDSSISPEPSEVGPLSSTFRSQLEELEGSCGSGPPQPLASSTLLWAGDELTEGPRSWTLRGKMGGPTRHGPGPPPQQEFGAGGCLSSPQPWQYCRVPGEHGVSPRTPLLCSAPINCSVACESPGDNDTVGIAAQHRPCIPWGPPMGGAGLGIVAPAAPDLGAMVLEVEDGGCDRSSLGDSSSASDHFVSAVETLEPSEAVGCPGAQHRCSPQHRAAGGLELGKGPSPRGAAVSELSPCSSPNLGQVQSETFLGGSRAAPCVKDGSDAGDVSELLAQLQGCRLQGSPPRTPEHICSPASTTAGGGGVTPQDQEPPRYFHVTPRTKSRLQAFAARLTASSSSLFDETLEFPWRPPRLRAPWSVPRDPALTPGHCITLGCEDVCSGEREGTGSLDDTELLPRASPEPSSPLGTSSSPDSGPTVLVVPGNHGHPQNSPSDAQGSPDSSPTVLLVPGDCDHPHISPPDSQGSLCATGSSNPGVLEGDSGWQDPSPLGTPQPPWSHRSFHHHWVPRQPGSTVVELGSPDVPLLLASHSTHHTGEHLEDGEQGQAPNEQHGTGVEASTEDAVVQDGRVCSDPAWPLSDEGLRQQLRVLGDDPGPVTELTRRLYLRRLEELVRKPRGMQAGHSPELVAALRTGCVPDCTQDELVLVQQFDCPDRSCRWREGLVKSSFNYLLLDPRTTQNLPLRSQHLSPAECFRTFIKAIFYVGKGTRARPYCHLAEALSQHRAGTQKGCPKVRRILEIWAGGHGVISVHCFQSTVPAEAYTREGCLVEALGLQTITNQRKGNCYGMVASWPEARRRLLGVHMLHRAMRIFLAEGERQLRPADIQGGR
ncbi:ankyrin repeat and LEM domain-containing protein 1 isoform 3-T3 [Porphyrio hochstetteri]